MSKSRDKYEDSEDETRPITTISDKGPSWSGRPMNRLKMALYALLGSSLFLYGWTVFFSERVSISNVSPELLGASSIMWLVAHPDDESMFFGPSIYNLLSEHEVPNGTHISPTGHILSLSMGGKDGLGPTRTVEMRGACLAYGIAPENCIVLDQARLPDDPNLWWPEDAVEYWVRTYIEKWSIDTIITFDEDGVSGHSNHRALCAAMTKAVNVDLQFPKVFTLRTARSVFSKYSALLLYPYVRLSYRWHMYHPLPKLMWDPDVHPIAKQKHDFLPDHPDFSPTQLQNGYVHPFSSHYSLFINSPWQYLKTRGAFKQHKSQLLWFRRLYMFASRYLWYNELEKIVPVHLRIVDIGKIRQAQKDSL